MEILSQTEIIEQTGGWPAGVVMLAGVVVFCILSFFFSCLCDLDEFGFVIGFMATIIIFFATLSIWNSKPTPTGRYKYKVVLDETYSTTQLYENYEVIGQDGKIWIIQDKESKD